MSAGGPARVPIWSVGTLIRHGARLFRSARLSYGHGTTNARDEAAWLTLHALRLPPALPPDRFPARVDPRDAARALKLFERRIRERVPAAYLTGTAWLDDLPFHVNRNVIVPRSHIAALLRERLTSWIPRTRSVRTALDLCTGSGCLAVFVARAFLHAQIDAVDVSAPALAVARRNIRDHRLAHRIRVIRSDLFGALRGKRYDLIVSNPPYVAAASMRRLPREYRHEPRLALAGGRDGLDLVKRIVQQAATHLHPGGVLVVEVGNGRARVERAFPRIAFTWPDTAGDDALFIAQREQLPD